MVMDEVVYSLRFFYLSNAHSHTTHSHIIDIHSFHDVCFLFVITFFYLINFNNAKVGSVARFDNNRLLVF